MVEYGLVLGTISELFSSFIWQMKSLWNEMNWPTILAIIIALFAFFYFLLRKR